MQMGGAQGVIVMPPLHGGPGDATQSNRDMEGWYDNLKFI